MSEETGMFTVGVFPDVEWAGRGLDALTQRGFPPEALTILGKQSTELAALIERLFGSPGQALEISGLGSALARGSLVEALQGSEKALTANGIAGSMRRVGFQPHDGRIYERLTARGGVLVAVRGEPRAADALAAMLSYGGGNAAIGAWAGRV